MTDAIGITASIGSPVKRTVLAMARSRVRLDPGEKRRSRQRDAAVGVELAVDGANPVPAGRAAGGGDRVGHENRPVRTLGSHHGLDGRRRQVMTVDDQAREERVGGQLLPDDIRMPGSTDAQPLPRWVDIVAPAAIASAICCGLAARMADRDAHAGRTPDAR